MAKPMAYEKSLVEKIILTNSFTKGKSSLLLAIEKVILKYLKLYCNELGYSCPLLKNLVVVNGFSDSSKIVKLTDSILKIKLLENKVLIVSSSATDMSGEFQYYAQSEMIVSLIAHHLDCDIEFYLEDDLSPNIRKFLESRNLNFNLNRFTPLQKTRVKRYKALR